MRKLISLFILASAPIFGDFYTSVGAGPFDLAPSLGVGYREDLDEHVFDAAFCCRYTRDINIMTVQGSLLYFPFGNDLYVGPSLAINRFDVRHGGDGWDQSVGVLIGKRLGTDFVDVSIHKEISSKDLSVKDPMMKVRYGVFF